ncbi:zinc metalloprotease HtpX [Desulfuribacillus stibiiarsenatis]|uniref:Protease HtpX homolog n=1 Tax=Desulfuribacillus stibiiarsenatis TaxID=1390249 RepID=A0A1E5L6G1_9FIRM|nr:protease HtpX [Desulfuribacillus stibiiarsenatis]OEH85614.1 zinc metalloprotease HtpX [Desulfuribacillus stibiiarsenatis]
MKRIGLFLLVNMLVLLTIVIVTTLLGVGQYIEPTGINYTSLLAFSMVVGFSGAFISLAISRWMAKMMMNVRVLDPRANLSPRERDLVEKVHTFARNAGITDMPEVGIYNSPEVNAFATGPSKNRSLVAVSSGLLQRMDDDAIEGVLAHEVAHVANGDMVTMTLVQGVINTFVVFLSRVAAFAASRFVREDMAHIVHFVLIIVFQILFGILGSIAVMAFSRYREYRADFGGADLAGKEKMIRALQQIKQSVHMVSQDQEAYQSLKINGGKSKLLGLFASHPDLDDRIRRLQER